MKKKTLIFIILILCIFSICLPVNAYTKKEDVIDSIDRISSKEYDLLHALNAYFDKYENDLKDVFTYENAINTNNYDFNGLITRVITLLNNKNHTSAANELSSLKPALVENYNYIKSEYAGVKEYLELNKSNGFLAIQSILLNAKNKSVKARSEFRVFYNKYFDVYFSELKTRIKNSNNFDGYEKLVDKVYENFMGTTKLINEISIIQEYYNVYHLEDFEEVIVDYLYDDYTAIYSKYTELYNYTKSVFKEKLDNKVASYKKSLDITNTESVANYNNKIYEIINKIEYYKNYYNTKKDAINKLIKIDTLKNKIIKEENKILEDIDKTVEYAKKFLVDAEFIKLVNSNDSSYIKIDNKNKLIIYYKTNLNKNEFLSKLKAVSGTLIVKNAFNNNIGTSTEIVNKISDNVSVTYTVVVKGDVSYNGKFDVTDVVNVADYMFKTKTYSGIKLMASDINDDNRIDITDIVKICDRIFGKGI